MATATFGCRPGGARRSLSHQLKPVALGSTDSRGCPHKTVYLHRPDHSPAAFGPLLGLSASSVSMTGAGPEMPPSFLTRQKWTIISTLATIGMPMQCQI